MGRLAITDNENTNIEINLLDETLEKINSISDKSIDLVFFEPFNRLLNLDNLNNLTKDERDTLISKVQMVLEAIKPKLKLHANLLIGTTNFSMTSFGESLYNSENVKRLITWHNPSIYEENVGSKMFLSSSISFIWVTYGKGWVYNLLEDEKSFKSEVSTKDVKEFTEQILLRFSNEKANVLEVFSHNDTIKNSAEKVGRNYIGISADEIKELLK